MGKYWLEKLHFTQDPTTGGPIGSGVTTGQRDPILACLSGRKSPRLGFQDHLKGLGTSDS